MALTVYVVFHGVKREVFSRKVAATVVCKHGPQRQAGVKTVATWRKLGKKLSTPDIWALIWGRNGGKRYCGGLFWGIKKSVFVPICPYSTFYNSLIIL